MAQKMPATPQSKDITNIAPKKCKRLNHGRFMSARRTAAYRLCTATMPIINSTSHAVLSQKYTHRDRTH